MVREFTNQILKDCVPINSKKMECYISNFDKNMSNMKYIAPTMMNRRGKKQEKLHSTH
ncbi:hypothetical protein YC2023_052468 [Brassica napus]